MARKVLNKFAAPQSVILPQQERVKDVVLHLPAAHPKQAELINSFDARRHPELGIIYDDTFPDFESYPLAFPQLRFVVGACGSKFGKASSIYQELPTTLGVKLMGEVSVGDYVFDENGHPTRIEYATDAMLGHTVYEVVFSDGSIVTADAEHWWVTETEACRKALADINNTTPVKRRRKSTEQKPEKRTTEEIRQTLTVKSGDKRKPNHSIPVVTAPLQYPPQNLAVDPYTLGAWLGNGSANCGMVCGIDDIVFASIGEFYPRYQTPYHAGGIEWSFSGLSTALNELHVRGNKHVPAQYLIGSTEQRLALLQGLMDTDGTISKRGDCSFYNTNLLLVDAVDELCCSLGIKVNRESKLPTFNGSRFQKNGKVYSTCYIAHFTTDLPVFRVPRKLARIRSVALKAKRRYIVDVRPVDSVPVRCIRVANPSHLYLVGKSCIPTHNTYGCSGRITKWAWENLDPLTREPMSAPGLFWWVAPSYAQSKYAYLLVKRLLPRGWFNEYKADLRLELINPDGDPHAFIEFKTGQDEDNLRGFGVHGFILDEAARMSRAAYDSVMTTVTQTMGKGVIITTPKGRGWVYEEFLKGQKVPGAFDEYPEWMSIRMPTWTNPWVPMKSVMTMKKNWPTDVFEQEVAARFLVESAGVFKGIRNCVADTLFDARNHAIFEQPQPGARYVMGVDLARKRDFTVINVIDVRRRHVVHFDRFNQISWELQKHRIVDISKRFNNATVWIDSTGVGDPITEDIRNSGVPVEGYTIGGSKAKQNLIEKLRTNIEQRRITYPEIPVQLKELENYEYDVNGQGVIRYSAPSGQHDDCVISLALANMGADQGVWKYRFSHVRGV